MKKILSIILFSFSLFVTIAQNKSFQLISFETDSCDNSYINPYKIKDRILDISENSDTILYTIRVSGNCCSKFDGTVEYKADSTIHFKFIESNQICACECGFTLFYKIYTAGKPIHYFLLNDKKLFVSEANDYDYYKKIKDKNGRLIKIQFFENGKLKFEQFKE